MDIKVTLVLTERGRKHTSLGFERIEVIDFGYAQDGTLETVLCIGAYSTCPHKFKAETSHVKNPNDSNSPICDGGLTGSFGIFPIVGADIFEDLFMHYNVEKEGE
jgi:hypothetical protein